MVKPKTRRSKARAKPKPPQLSMNQRAFLVAFEDTGNVRLAAQSAGINRREHYRWMAMVKHPYLAAFADAREAAADLLEAEARRRAYHGVQEPVVYQGQLSGIWIDDKGRTVAPETAGARLIPLTVTKYSDTLMIFLLKGARPQVYRERFDHSLTGPDGGPIEVEHLPPSDEATAEVLNILIRAGAFRTPDSGKEGEEA